jgi:hypothetical protein
MVNPQWTYNSNPVDELPEDCEGFVYLITNLADGRKYVGKKLAKFKKTRPPLKGKKNKRREKVESDWQDYWVVATISKQMLPNLVLTSSLARYCTFATVVDL